MLTFIGVEVIILVITIIVGHKYYYHDDEVISCFLGASVLGILLSILLVQVFFPIVFSDPNMINYEFSTKKIVALKDNTNTVGAMSGGIFIVSGQIDTELYYYYMEETPYGYTTGKVPAEESYIKYDNSCPRIEHHYGANYKKWICNALTIGAPPETSWYEIYVPEGTVVEQFKIDLE